MDVHRRAFDSEEAEADSSLKSCKPMGRPWWETVKVHTKMERKQKLFSLHSIRMNYHGHGR